MHGKKEKSKMKELTLGLKIKVKKLHPDAVIPEIVGDRLLFKSISEHYDTQSDTITYKTGIEILNTPGFSISKSHSPDIINTTLSLVDIFGDFGEEVTFVYSNTREFGNTKFRVRDNIGVIEISRSLDVDLVEVK